MTYVLLIIITACIQIGIAAAKHGKPKNDTYSIWWQLVSAFITWGILKGFGLLEHDHYWVGLW